MKKLLFNYFFVILITLFSCKKNTNTGISLNKGIDSIARVERGSAQKLDSLKKKGFEIKKSVLKPDSLKESRFEIEDLEKIPNIKLPLGSPVIMNYLFPKKFGNVFTEENAVADITKKNYNKAVSNNNSFYNISKGIKIKDPFFLKNNFTPYSYINIRQRDSILNNIHAIGKFITGKYHLILKKTSNSMSFSNLKSISVVSVDEKLNKIDELRLYSSISDNGRRHVETFFINKEQILFLKTFLSEEGEITFLSEKKYRVSKLGKFIRYYKTNGVYKDDLEKGLVQNFTREGKWIEKKISKFLTSASGDCFVESYYKDEQAVRTWSYYEIDSKSSDNSILEIQKGKLLYTETYKNGEMVKRDFIKND